MATTLSTTTLSLALGASALRAKLASVSNVSVGQTLVIDNEALAVTGIAGLWVDVRRGAAGTTAAAHAAAATVTIANPSQLYTVDPEGVPETPPLVTPWINLTTGTQWVVSGSTWVPSSTGGISPGNVVGPASATDNAVARFDATTGKLLQNSAVTIADTTGDIVTAGDVKAASFHVGATAGATAGPFTTITSITVVAGIITDLQGS